MKQTQYNTVLKHLRMYGLITSWEAFQEYGITRLSAIIFNLRQNGYNIETENKTVRTRLGNNTNIGVYRLDNGTK